MSSIVVDASALLGFLLDQPTARRLDQLLAGTTAAHAPHLLDTELIQALRGLVRGGEVTEPRARQALDHAGMLPIEYHPHAPFSSRVWSLRDVASAYDSTYVALAEGLGATLVTADVRLARAVSRLVPVVTTA